MAMGGLLPEGGTALQLSSHPKSAMCLACPGHEAAPHGFHEQEADAGSASQGAGGQQGANLPPSLLPPATATLGSSQWCWELPGEVCFPFPRH